MTWQVSDRKIADKRGKLAEKLSYRRSVLWEIICAKIQISQKKRKTKREKCNWEFLRSVNCLIFWASNRSLSVLQESKNNSRSESFLVTTSHWENYFKGTKNLSDKKISPHTSHVGTFTFDTNTSSARPRKRRRRRGIANKTKRKKKIFHWRKWAASGCEKCLPEHKKFNLRISLAEKNFRVGAVSAFGTSGQELVEVSLALINADYSSQFIWQSFSRWNSQLFPLFIGHWQQPKTCWN